MLNGCVKRRNLDQRLGKIFSGAIALGLAHNDDSMRARAADIFGL